VPDDGLPGFEPAGEADADILLHLARAFHAEEGHPLDADSTATVVGIACGEPLARGWTLHLEVEVRNDRAARLYCAAGFEQTGRRLMRLRLQAGSPNAGG
jgi:hypothetical protein